MKNFLLSATAFIGLMSFAQAADLGTRKPSPVLPVMASYNWTGLYVGLQGGYGFAGDIKHRQGGATSGNFDINGGLIGGTIGYNYQLANGVVLGAEGDYAWANIKGSTGVGCAAPGCRTEIQSFGTVRARVGYAFDRVMPYIAGGLALGQIRGSSGGIAGSDLQAGWTIGAGVEAAVWQNVSVKLEYLYADFGRNDYVSAPAISTNARAHIVRGGVNYRF